MRVRLELVAFGLLARVIAPFSAHAISESNYRQDYDEYVVPYINAVAKEGEIRGQNGVPLRYRKLEQQGEIGAIVLVQGFGDSYLLDAELQYDLANQGYSVYELDHRGQGLSGRLIPDSIPGYIDQFDYLAADLKTFVDTVVNAVPHKRRFLIASSLGGPIAALYLAGNPGQFNGAALAAPLMELNLGERTEEQALREIAPLLAQGKGAEYSWGARPYDPEFHHDPNSQNGMDKRLCVKEDLVLANPRAALGGPSWQWIYQGILGSRKARTEAAQAIQVPLLMLVAGNDQVARREGQDEFCYNAPDCRTFEMADSSHAMLTERDTVRIHAFYGILRFFRLLPDAPQARPPFRSYPGY